jgi:hypothetical protein
LTARAPAGNCCCGGAGPLAARWAAPLASLLVVGGVGGGGGGGGGVCVCVCVVCVGVCVRTGWCIHYAQWLTSTGSSSKHRW